MEFRFFTPELPQDRTLSVDGVMPSRINLSHWPGNRTPVHLHADTSTEMALKLAAAPNRVEMLRGIEVVTNNHFDTDGLLSAWAVLNPALALERSEQLIAAAEVGDFEWSTTAEAVKFDITVMAFEDSERSPLAAEFQGTTEDEKYQLIYDRLLAELPGLLDDVEAYRSLWEEEFAFWEESMQEMKNGGTVLWEYPEIHLSVFQATRYLDKRVRFHYAGNWRVLTFVPEGDGWTYELEHQIFTWFETVTFPNSHSMRIDLEPLAAHLSELETGVGRWRFTGTDDLNSRLHFVDRRGRLVPSDLPIVRLLEETRKFLSRFEEQANVPRPPISARQPI
jgi:hypothetical protein